MSALYTLYLIRSEHGEFQKVMIAGEYQTCGEWIRRCEVALRKEGIKI
jgi:hypothetical protein